MASRSATIEPRTASRWPFQSSGKAVKPEAVEAAWREYRASRSPEARDVLVQRYIHLVRYMAGRLSRTLPPTVEFDDLVSAGVMGFLAALDGFDASHGIDFSVYALTRIRGAMVDFVREIDPVGRVTRRKLREAERVLSQLEQELSRPVSDAEAATRLGVTMDAFHDLMSRATASSPLSLERGDGDGDEEGEISGHDWIADAATKDPLTTLEERDGATRLTAMVGALSPAQQLVLHLRYVEELNFREVAMVMDVSESRATELHAAALSAVRSQAAGRPARGRRGQAPATR
jgi:RNA polymerase sigma factor for flagellar operon FliA